MSWILLPGLSVKSELLNWRDGVTVVAGGDSSELPDGNPNDLCNRRDWYDTCRACPAVSRSYELRMSSFFKQYD